MRRKTFVKQLMALGFSRNAVNKACEYARWMERRINKTLQGCKFSASWEETLAYVVKTIETGKIPCEEADMKMYMNKASEWRAKRSKKMPQERMGAIVEEWAKEHPVETRQSRFLKEFPNTSVQRDGTIDICPLYMDETIECKAWGDVVKECIECEREFWGTEV